MTYISVWRLFYFENQNGEVRKNKSATNGAQ